MLSEANEEKAASTSSTPPQTVADQPLKPRRGWVSMNEPVASSSKMTQADSDNSSSPERTERNPDNNEQSRSKKIHGSNFKMLDEDENTSANEGASTKYQSTPAKPAKGKKGRKPGILTNNYSTYPGTTTDEEMIAGDPNLIAMDNIFRLGKKFAMGELAKKMLEHHPDSGISGTLLSNRLTRAVTKIATRDGRDRDELIEEMRAAQKARGLTANGKRKAPVAVTDDGEKKVAKKAKVALTTPKKLAGEIADSEEDSATEEEDGGEPAASFRTIVPGMEGPPSRIAQLLASRDQEAPGEEKDKTASPGQKAVDGRVVHLGTYRSW